MSYLSSASMRVATGAPGWSAISRLLSSWVALWANASSALPWITLPIFDLVRHCGGNHLAFFRSVFSNLLARWPEGTWMPAVPRALFPRTLPDPPCSLRRRYLAISHPVFVIG